MVTFRRAPPQPAVAIGKGDRLWEIDLLRTVAIGMMVTYHVGYDIDALAPSVGLDPFNGGWRALQVATGSTFLLLVGLSASISNARARARGLGGHTLYRHHARRAAEVLAAAAVVSLVTYLALGDAWVRFGILHLIGVAMLLAPFTVRLGVWNLALGVMLVVAGLALRSHSTDRVAGFVLGFAPGAEAGVDLYPLLPWLGPVAIGVGLGALLYPGGRRGPLVAWITGQPPAVAGAVSQVGRRSLAIYLVHQPLLIPLVAGALTAAGADIDTDGFG